MDIIKAVILQYSKYYVILDVNNRFIYNDEYIAFKLGMSIDDYHDGLRKFNGKIKSQVEGMFFISAKDADDAADWVNSIIIINNLSKNK